MKTTETLLAQLEREAARTRRVLEATPEGRNDWKPHERSMPLGRLALLVATMPSWFPLVLEQDELDIAPKDGPKFGMEPAATRGALVAAFEKAMEQARASLAKTTDERLKTTWRLMAGGKLASEDPRGIVLEDTLMHQAHHRGQLTVYLRLCDAKVPSVYGPTADDPSFG